MSSKIDKLHFILVGISGIVMGLKVALLHSGEVKAEVLNMLQRDIDEAQQVLARLDVEPVCQTCGDSREVDDTIHSVNAGIDISKPCPDCKPEVEPNKRAIKLLEEWFAEPDNMGEEFWREFDELAKNRFTI